VDNKFKERIQVKREELAKMQEDKRFFVDDNTNEQQHSEIAEAFTTITDEHALTLKKLRQALDLFMDHEVHQDLSQAARSLSL